MAGLAVKTLRPAGEGRAVKRDTFIARKENNQIIQAARAGDTDTLVSMSHSGIDVTTARNTDKYGDTVLHEACYYGHSTAVAVILTSKISVDVRNTYQETPMHRAALENHIEIIKLLKNSGATVDAKDIDGDTPLHDAAYYGHTEAVDYLIGIGATVDITNNVLQQKMKGLLRTEAKLAADNKDVNTCDSLQEKQSKEDESLTKDQERRAFQLAMRNGVSNSLNFRLSVFGPENSGKSCLVDTLFDDIFQKHEATEGADVHICTIYANNWQKCTQEQMAENIEIQFFHGLNVSAKEQVKSSCFQASFKTKKQGILTKFKAVLFRSSRTDSPQISRAPEVKPEEIEQAKAVKIISQNEFTAIVWDFAGQIQYLSTHTVFVRRNNVVFIVFKASCLLSDFIKARPGDQDSASYSKPVTYFHVIHYWLQTITSVCHDAGGADHMSEFLPTAVLIATHIDEIIGNLKWAKKEIIAQLAKELEGKPYAKHLAGNLPGVGLLEALEKFCIFLSNTDRDENVINLLKDIVLQISAPSMKETHPLIYLKIEKELLVLGKEVITKTQFHKVAVENGFIADKNSMEMKGALDHFHQKGVILHFPSIDSLKELVFLSPQWLEKLIAFLIVAHHYKTTGDKDDLSYRRLKNEGVLVGSFLEHSLQMFNTLHRVIGCEISFNQAIAFLSNFGFIAEISNTTEFLEEYHPWSEKEKRIFIVPSQLPEDKERKRSKFISGKHVWTVYFTFIDGFIPLTIFHQTIAACINWNESRQQNIVRLQKYEIMMILNHDQYYSVNLCEEKSSIQVDIILGHSMKKSAENRKHLINFFQTMLEKICHDLIPASSKPIPYIQCPHCDKVHLKLRNALEGRALMCNMIPIHKDYYQDLFREYQVEQCRKPEYVKSKTTTSRGTECPPVPCQCIPGLLKSISCGVPTMKQLMEIVIPRVAADWKQLAFMLEFDISRVNIIKQKGRDDPESCCCELLYEWLDSDHGIKPKNWTTLLTALKQIKKLTSVINEIEKDLTLHLTVSQDEPDDNNTTSSPHTSKMLSQAPLMHQVLKVVVPRIAGHWKAVAYNLHYDVTRVRIIQEQCRDDPEQCSCELFMYWLQSSEGLGPRSWETLLSALKQIPKLKAVTESIEKELIELQSLMTSGKQ